MRRSDGSSVYLTAGSDVFTSASVLAAEDALLDLGGHVGGRTVPGPVVELALLEAAANGRPLNGAQAHLVRVMATSGARVQLALAPAGTGKTTGLRVLAWAWTDSGSTVLGLTPSAIAGQLVLSQKTVQNHISNIFSKLQVADRAQAIVLARQAGLGES